MHKREALSTLTRRNDRQKDFRARPDLLPDGMVARLYEMMERYEDPYGWLSRWTLPGNRGGRVWRAQCSFRATEG